MKFECLKTLHLPCDKEASFIKGKIYESTKNSTRCDLEVINEQGFGHGIGTHWLYYKFDKFFKEYFKKVSN